MKRLLPETALDLVVLSLLSLICVAPSPLGAETVGSSAESSVDSGQVDSRQAERMLEQRIIERLANSQSLAGSDIEVRVSGRTALVKGIVGSEAEAHRVERLVLRTRGIRQVDLDLDLDREVVGMRRSTSIDDDVLARTVAETLAKKAFPLAEAEESWLFGWEVEGISWEFDVDVDGGRVTLEGDVDSREKIVEAVEVARRIPGVKAVENRLGVDDFPPFNYFPYPFSWDRDDGQD